MIKLLTEAGGVCYGQRGWSPADLFNPTIHDRDRDVNGIDPRDHDLRPMVLRTDTGVQYHIVFRFFNYELCSYIV